MNDLHYAVVVGINRYPAIGDLQGARGDAVRFRDWLVDSDGGAVPEGNVALVTASKEEELTADFMSAVPTREVVNRALYEIHRAVAQAIAELPGEQQFDAWQRTRLYLFLAGHGIGLADNSAGLLMANAAIDLLGNHVAVRPYLDWYVAASPFREIVCFADCCRTGYRGSPPFGPPFSGTTQDPEDVDCFVGFATALGDPAYEEQHPDPDLARGHFTTALLDGLRGGAARNGLITSDSLSDYVVRHVEDRTQTMLVPQRPRFTKGNAPMLFAGELAVQAYPVKLCFPDGFRGWVQLRGGGPDQSPLRLHVDSGECVEKLTPGLYRATAESVNAADFRNGGFFEVMTGGGNGVQL
ncbi:caspase domain-containing protein [Streptomyces rectiviolaceus]|uniref:Caspase family protein n=1 Tax=Streptomyces rectiviolaceus TaxID=332591 RepID=A0ABP6N1E9_9ACTN